MVNQWFIIDDLWSNLDPKECAKTEICGNCLNRLVPNTFSARCEAAQFPSGNRSNSREVSSSCIEDEVNKLEAATTDCGFPLFSMSFLSPMWILICFSMFVVLFFNCFYYWVIHVCASRVVAWFHWFGDLNAMPTRPICAVPTFPMSVCGHFAAAIIALLGGKSSRGYDLQWWSVDVNGMVNDI